MLHQALATAERHSDRRAEELHATILDTLATVYADLAPTDRNDTEPLRMSIELHRRAIASVASRAGTDDRRLADMRINLALALAARMRPAELDEAVALLEQATLAYSGPDDALGRARVESHLCEIALLRDELDPDEDSVRTGIEHGMRALEALAGGAGAKRVLSFRRIIGGQLYRKDRFAEALPFLRAASDAATDLHDASVLMRSRSRDIVAIADLTIQLGFAYAHEHRAREALEALEHGRAR
jgi:hypothetical protein